jgi:thiol-disulfide isomerase/thioredoxin
MNISKLILPLLLLANLSFAQKLTLSGNIRSSDTVLHLTNRIKGTNIKIPIGKDKSFNATVNIPGKGIYVLNSVAELYLSPGNNVRIVPSDSLSYQFSGPGALENSILHGLKAEKKILPLGGDLGIPFYVLNREASFFLDRLDTYQQNIATKVSQSKDPFFINITNGLFRNMSQSLLKTYLKHYGLDSLVMDMLVHPRADGYYKPNDQMTVLTYTAATLKKNYLTEAELTRIHAALLKEFSWNDEQLFYNASSYMDNMIERLKESAPKNQYGHSLPQDEEALAIMKIIDGKIQNRLIKNYMKGNFGLIYLQSGKDEKPADSVYQILKEMSLPIAIRNEIEAQRKGAKLLKMDPTAIDFAYKTIGEEVVTLKSLRGKYVYIDLWATWCAPCKAEIPALKKLEHEFKDKSIHFVSISLDKQTDKNTWINFVKENQLSGIQLMADKDFNSEFPKIFQVNSIPRFILIAPDGKIVSANADRPSNPELKAQLSKLLN